MGTPFADRPRDWRNGYQAGYRAGRTGLRRHRELRWNPDVEAFEAKCLTCSEWWPLDLTAWQPKNGLVRCRACWVTYHRNHEAGRRRDESVRAARLEAMRLKYRANRTVHLEASRRWKAAHRDYVTAYNRTWRARRKAAA